MKERTGAARARPEENNTWGAAKGAAGAAEKCAGGAEQTRGDMQLRTRCFPYFP